LNEHWSEQCLRLINPSGKSCFACGLTMGKMKRDFCIHTFSFLEQKLAGEGLTIED
jgi:hypothetical protein